MPSLFKLAVILMPLCFLLHTEAAPLKEKSPHILRNTVETDRDDTYGPWERNSWIGNAHPDDLHHDDLWPPMVPPRAVVRHHGPTIAAFLSRAENDTDSKMATHCPHEIPIEGNGPLLLLHGCCHHPLHPHQITASPKPGSTAIVTPIVQKRELSTPETNKESVLLNTGAQQWQEYWAHEIAVTSVPPQDVLSAITTLKPTLAQMAQPSPVTATGEAVTTSAGTALSTGAQQWQVYWNHLTPRRLLRDDLKFALFAGIFGLPNYVTAAVLILAHTLDRTSPQPNITARDTQPRAPVVVMAMCDTVGQILDQDSFQGMNSSGVLASAVGTTCKSFAQLYPQHMVEAQPVTMSHRLIITKMFDFFNSTTQLKTLAASHISKEVLIEHLATGGSLSEGISQHIEPQSTSTTTDSPREMEIHIPPYSIPSTPTSSSFSSATLIQGASTTHDSTIQPRAFYLFQPLEAAYTWMNDIYDVALSRHPRFPYNDPAQDINGCIYYPSPDRDAILGKVICPPDGDHKE